MTLDLQLEQVLANFSTQAAAWASNISSKAVNWVLLLLAERHRDCCSNYVAIYALLPSSRR